MKKVVIITGASRGFGELIAKKFQKENFQVIATMRNVDSSPSLKELDNVDIKKLDVTNKSDIKDVVDFTIEKYGRVDVLINNAGYGAFGFLEEASNEEIRYQYDVNFFGLIDCIKAVIPQMRKQKEGVIINAPKTIVPIIEPTYDSNKSAPIPATSPTLSPTLSAIVAGFRGWSSGIPASTLPTKSAPTSAALV